MWHLLSGREYDLLAARSHPPHSRVLLLALCVCLPSHTMEEPQVFALTVAVLVGLVCIALAIQTAGNVIATAILNSRGYTK
jgi:hypothetical protein